MLTKTAYYIFLAATIILSILIGYLFFTTGDSLKNLIMYPIVTAILTYKLHSRHKENQKKSSQFNIKNHAKCPFCGTSVGESYSLCASCGAERITTFKELFEKELKINPFINRLGLLGLLIGFGLGFCAFGLTMHVPTSIFVGVVVFIIVMFGPTFIRTSLLWENSKVNWFKKS